MKKIELVWFKRDLRVSDHAPLYNASLTNFSVVPLYIVEPELWSLPFMSRRHWHFLNECLHDLRRECGRLGQPLVVRIGNSIDIFENLTKSFHINHIWVHQETSHSWSFDRDKKIKVWCRTKGIKLMEYPSNGIVRGLSDRNHWSKIRQTRLNFPITPLPEVLKSIGTISLGQIPSKDDKLFGESLNLCVQPGGRKEAIKIFQSFASLRSKSYMRNISSPLKSSESCSRLSPHLTWGTISVKEVIHFSTNMNQHFLENSILTKKNLKAFSARLAWRCHFIQKLEDMPDIETKCMHPYYEFIRSDFDTQKFNAWKNGVTGYPYIDACMRSLMHTGWLNFRARATLVSFASYHLWLDWRDTGNYLAQLFTDFEPGIHFCQMQMQSGVTGINTKRIYNPVTQSTNNDATGCFIRKWVPELSNLPNEYVHQPWLMDRDYQKQKKCILGTNYPNPIINHIIEF